MSSVYGRVCLGCGHDEVMVAFLPLFADEGRQKRDADGCGLIECSGCGRVQSDYEELSKDGVNEPKATSDDAGEMLGRALAVAPRACLSTIDLASSHGRMVNVRLQPKTGKPRRSAK